jgi:hypothetical protein
VTATDPSVDTRAPLWVHLLCFSVALLLFIVIVIVNDISHTGQRVGLTVALAALASVGLTALVGMVMERRPLFDGQQTAPPLFHLKDSSWAALADVFLVALVGLAAAYRPSLNDGGLMFSRWWILIALAAGLVAAVGFHFVLDAPNYVKTGAESLLSAPTKLVHNEITYFVLAASLVYLAVPILLTSSWSSWVPWLIVGCLAIWIVGGIRDKGLDLYRLHRPYDYANHRPL